MTTAIVIHSSTCLSSKRREVIYGRIGPWLARASKMRAELIGVARYCARVVLCIAAGILAHPGPNARVPFT